jgi:hypothetical protein
MYIGRHLKVVVIYPVYLGWRSADKVFFPKKFFRASADILVLCIAKISMVECDFSKQKDFVPSC